MNKHAGYIVGVFPHAHDRNVEGKSSNMISACEGVKKLGKCQATYCIRQNKVTLYQN